MLINKLSEANPFKSISAAAQLAQPGDVITVHEGILGRPHHTGAIYLNDHWLTEATTFDEVMKPAEKTIERGFEHGWSEENIGHHIVRNNSISHCEQAGIVGSLGAMYG